MNSIHKGSNVSSKVPVEGFRCRSKRKSKNQPIPYLESLGATGRHFLRRLARSKSHALNEFFALLIQRRRFFEGLSGVRLRVILSFFRFLPLFPLFRLRRA